MTGLIKKEEGERKRLAIASLFLSPLFLPMQWCGVIARAPPEAI